MELEFFADPEPFSCPGDSCEADEPEPDEPSLAPLEPLERMSDERPEVVSDDRDEPIPDELAPEPELDMPAPPS